MKILIADDEPLARARLRQQLERLGGYEIIAEAANGREALEQAAALKPDIVMLDIRMPVMTGLEAAAELSRQAQPPAVIFTTAYDEHALEAFDADAVDYLRKPIRKSRLEQALKKAGPPNRDALNKTEIEPETRRHICAQQRGGVVLIPIEDILYFHADAKYTAVHHLQGEVLIDEPLKALELEFKAQFTRIHRNALVANAYIRALEKGADGQHYVVLKAQDLRLEVSRRMTTAVKEVIAAMASTP